jgi:hypothetical protein
VSELAEAISLEAQFQQEAYDRLGFPRFVDGFNLREAGRKSWHAHTYGRPIPHYVVALQTRMEAADAAIKDEDRPEDRPWRGDSVWTVANRATRRAMKYGRKNH